METINNEQQPAEGFKPQTYSIASGCATDEPPYGDTFCSILASISSLHVRREPKKGEWEKIITADRVEKDMKTINR